MVTFHFKHFVRIQINMTYHKVLECMLIFHCTNEEDIIDKEAPLSRFNFDNIEDDYIVKIVCNYLDSFDIIKL